MKIDVLMPFEDPAARRCEPLAGRDCLPDTPEARLRLMAATRMASTLVHEVSQPLTAAANSLAACARRLRGLGPEYADVLAMLDHAATETLKAGELLRNTRNFVVSGRITPRRENLRTMVERAILMLGDRREAIGITSAVPLDLFVQADRLQLEQALSALLFSACEALAGGTDGWIELEARRLDGEVLLAIADNGPGIPEAVLAQLAAPPAPENEATGLAVAAVIAAAHGGRLTAANRGEGGTRFELSLPDAD